MEATYEMARRMAVTIPRFHDLIGAFFNEHLGKAFPDAPAQLEIASYSDPEIMRTAYSQGGMLVDVALDHLMGLSKTLTEPVEVFTPWVCVRAVFESSALAAWFLEPGITGAERAKRSFAFRFEGLTQQLKFLQAWKTKSADIEGLKRQIEELEETAFRLGMDRLRDRKGKRMGIGMPMPSVTELITSVFHDEPSYRLQSAMAHGHHWALQQLGYRVHENDDGKSDYVMLTKHISAAAAGHLCTRAVRAFAKPAWYRSCRNGWDAQRIREILELAYNDMLINERERFWRSSSSPGA